MRSSRLATSAGWIALSLAGSPSEARADPCSLDRHCGPGRGCYVPEQRCERIEQIAEIQVRDRNQDLAFVIPVTLLGVGAIVLGAILASQDEVVGASIGLSVGSLFTLIGAGGATAIGIKKQRHEARLHELERRLARR